VDEFNASEEVGSDNVRWPQLYFENEELVGSFDEAFPQYQLLKKDIYGGFEVIVIHLSKAGRREVYRGRNKSFADARQSAWNAYMKDVVENYDA
jgi:hypothetical protein